MGNKKENINEVVVVMIAVILAAMLFIPIPAEWLDILVRIQFIISTAVLIYSLTSYFKSMVKLVLYYSVTSLAINISLCRLILQGLRNGIIKYQLSFMGGEVSGGLIINTIFLLIFLAIIIIISLLTKTVTESIVRYFLDSMNGKLCEIDNKCSTNLIMNGNSEFLKEELKSKIDFNLSLDRGIKVLVCNVHVSVFFYLLEIVNGTLIEKYRNGKILLESVSNATKLTLCNIKVFFPSLVFVSIAIVLKVTKMNKTEEQKYQTS